MTFTKIVKVVIKVKQKVSAESFRNFIESISIVKKCELNNKNEAIIELNNGTQIKVQLAVTDLGYPKQIMDVISRIKSEVYSVIIAPYISEQTSKICSDAGVGYLDMAGNCNIACDYLYISINGNKNVNVPKRGLKSIFEKSSVVSSVILRIMLDDINRTWKLKDLANEAGCSIGQVSKVKDFLLKYAYIEQDSEGIRIVNVQALLENWADTFGRSSEEYITCYSLDNIPDLEMKISKMKEEIGIDCVLTGFSGGSRYQPVVRYQKVHAYINEADVDKAINYLGLKRVESGANVVLIIIYDDCIKYNATIQNNSMVVSPVQLYLDLKNIKGRGEEMAKAILEREICK